MTMNGMYVGNDPASVAAAEKWLGSPLDIVGAHTGRASWADWTGSIGWMMGQMKAVNAELRWSIPIFANGSNLTDAANHAYDHYYVEAAKKLIAGYGPDDTIIVRVGEEFNGNWMPWAAAGREEQYTQAYRNFVDAFRSVGQNFKFEWNVNIGETRADVVKAYPGDAYVDFIGMDFYWDSQASWSIKDPIKAFDYFKTTTYGLQWLEDFAAQHGKQTAYSEWGVNSPDAGVYIQQVKAWFDSHDVAYELYWNSNADFRGMISNGQHGAAGDVYRTLFGGGGTMSTATGDLQIDFAMTATGTGTLFGNALDNVLVGNAGNNILDGREGADRMTGGKGNDTYHVDNARDVVVELAGEGTDTILSTVSYSLVGIEVENLTLTGTAAINAYGNGLPNTLTGNAANNILSGGAGADRMVGGKGDDVYYVDNAGDKAIELTDGGTDSVFSSVSWALSGTYIENLTLTGSAISASGNSLDNVLTGNDANNVITGGGGADRMIGGKGDDSYYVDDIRDVVIEKAGEGNDMVYSSVSYSLAGTAVEKLLIYGSAVGATGNALDNILTASGDVANIIDGGAGADRMIGGKGDDIYSVDNIGDVVVEKADQGYDQIYASVSYNLAGIYAEGLTLTGSARIDAIGNSLANVLVGNDAANVLNGLGNDDIIDGGGGNDIIRGGTGHDEMTGGSGSDVFVFASADFAPPANQAVVPYAYIDVIKDFQSGQGDKVDLSAVDANLTKAGLQHFTFIADAAFSGAGQLRIAQQADGLYLTGNVDANLAPDFAIKLTNVVGLGVADLIL